MATKTTILRIVLLFLFSTFFAADAIFGQTAIGVKGGVNFCNYGGRYITSNYQEKITVPLGLLAQFQTNSWFSV